MCPRMRMQEESSGVTQKMSEVTSPDGKQRLSFMVWEMTALELLSRSWSWSGALEQVKREFLFTKTESTKQSIEPESTNAETVGILYDSRTMAGIREFGSERADMLRWISKGAKSESTQSPGCVESWGLQTSVLTPKDQD